MKLKYYLRGLGIGIAVTALVLYASGKQAADEMTDEQIRARAMELGMVEESLLSDVLQDSAEEKNKIEEAVTEADTQEITSEEPSKEEPLKKEASSEEPSGEKSSSEEPSIEEKTSEESEEEVTTEEAKGEIQTIDGESKKPPVEDKMKPATDASEDQEIEIIVKSGESSVAISKKLAAAGLVSNAARYDAYLCKNGYDKKICTGSHIIKKGATEEEIAKIITTK